MRKFAKTKKLNHRQSGYGLIFAAFGLVVLLGAAGLSVDVGYLRYQRRLVQSATDSAALAGAAQLGAGGTALQAQTAAENDSSLNGFPQGGRVTITTTPTTVNGNSNTLQVQITKNYPTFFMRILGASFNTVNVSTTATAQYLGGRGCIYTLAGGGGINLTGGGSINVPNCNVLSNQSISGGGSIRAAAVGAHGSSIASTPPAITGTVETSDPLSYLAAPPAGAGCTDINYSNDHTGAQPPLNPGRYCEIVLNPFVPGRRGGPGTPANNSNLTFKAGTYIITGAPGKNGGLDLEGNGTITGTAGVTFYIQTGGVTVGANQTIHLSAPTNGSYPGILFFQPTGNNTAATIRGNGGGSYMEGALYFPNATLNLRGSANNASNNKIDYMILVAKTLNIQTAVNFQSDYSSLPKGYSPVRTASLIQ